MSGPPAAHDEALTLHPPERKNVDHRSQILVMFYYW